MVGVGADVADEAVDRGVDLLEDPVVDRLGDPPRRLRLEAFAERGPVVLHEPAEADEHGVEQALVVAAFHGEIDRPAEHRCRRDGPHPLPRRRARGGLHLVIVEHLERAAQRIGEAVGGAPGVVGLRQPGAEAPSDSGIGEPLTEHVVGEEVLLDELAETAPDLVLALRDDRGVRDRDAERMPEQRGHGEPISQRTDHRRLRRGEHVADPAASLSAVRAITYTTAAATSIPVATTFIWRSPAARSASVSATVINPHSHVEQWRRGKRGERRMEAADAASSPPSGTSHLWQASTVTNYTEIVGGLAFPEGPIAMPDGTVVLVELGAERLTRVHPNGTTTTVAEIAGGPNGAAVGPDGAIYVCNNGGSSTFVEFDGKVVPGRFDPRATSADGSSVSTPAPAPSPTCTPSATVARCDRRTTW